MGRYVVHHSFREEMIVPYVGFHSNIDVWNDEDERIVLTADNVVATLVDIKEKNICQLEEDIQRLYKMSCWDFMKRWYKADKRMDSMTMLCIKLKKIE